MPDGLLCSNGQILKKTGAGDWDCAADAGGSVSSNSLDFDEIVNSMTLDANLTISTGGFFFGLGATPTTVFEVQGTASASYLLTGNTLQVGGYSSAAYSRFGTIATTHSNYIADSSDLFISGDLEGRGSISFAGAASLSLSLFADNNRVSMDKGAFYHNVSTGISSINYLQTGGLNFDSDAGVVSWADMAVTASTASGGVLSYTAQIAGTPVLTVYGLGTGSANVISNPRVGIGTTTPKTLFYIRDVGAGSAASGSLAIFSDNTVGTVASISAKSLTSGDVLKMTVPASTSHRGRYLLVETAAGVTYASLGYGGRFSIARDILSDGATSTCTGAGVPSAGCVDVAEEFPTTENIAKGEVVSLDSDNESVASVKRASQLYDDKLLGVVTTKPGIVLGNNVYTGSNAEGYISKNGNVLVALVGRVPVQISYENGDIKKGDYLTSSSIPGKAAKAVESGRVIGMALEEALDGSDKQTLMVFVNPHYWVQGLAFDAYTDSSISSDADILFESIIQKLQTIFEIAFEKGILKVAQIISDKIITKELCLEEVCIKKEQLQNFLNQNDLQNSVFSTPTPTPESTPTPTPESTPTPTPVP